MVRPSDEQRERTRAAFAPVMERRCRVKETLAREAAEDLGVELVSVEFSRTGGGEAYAYSAAEGTPEAARSLFGERMALILGNTAFLVLRDGSCPECDGTEPES